MKQLYEKRIGYILFTNRTINRNTKEFPTAHISCNCIAAGKPARIG